METHCVSLRSPPSCSSSWSGPPRTPRPGSSRSATRSPRGCSTPTTAACTRPTATGSGTSSASNGYDVDFVGSRSDPDFPGYSFDKANEGHGGYTIGGIVDGVGDAAAGQLSTWLGGYYPDIALVLIGTNDVLANTNMDDPVLQPRPARRHAPREEPADQDLRRKTPADRRQLSEHQLGPDRRSTPSSTPGDRERRPRPPPSRWSTSTRDSTGAPTTRPRGTSTRTSRASRRSPMTGTPRSGAPLSTGHARDHRADADPEPVRDHGPDGDHETRAPYYFANDILNRNDARLHRGHVAGRHHRRARASARRHGNSRQQRGDLRRTTSRT